MITVWHLFSVICIIASTASASGIAKSQHASAAAYGLCILVAILPSSIAAFGNLSCATIVRGVIRNQGQSVKIAMLSLLLVASVGWIVLADLARRWMSIAVLHMFIRYDDHGAATGAAGAIVVGGSAAPEIASDSDFYLPLAVRASTA
jgi:hypothetical protein